MNVFAYIYDWYTFYICRKVVLKDDLPEEDLAPVTSNNWTVVHSFKRMKRTTGNLSIPSASKPRVPETENWDDDLLAVPLPRKTSFKTPQMWEIPGVLAAFAERRQDVNVPAIRQTTEVFD